MTGLNTIHDISVKDKGVIRIIAPEPITPENAKRCAEYLLRSGMLKTPKKGTIVEVPMIDVPNL
jgi:hypothetical protein